MRRSRRSLDGRVSFHPLRLPKRKEGKEGHTQDEGLSGWIGEIGPEPVPGEDVVCVI